MLNTIITLRQATQTDWPAIASLLKESKLPLEGARERLSDYLLAMTQGEVIGCAAAEVYGDAALLHSVAVAPRMHRRGIGKILVSGVLQEATDRHIAKVYLLTVNASDYFAQFGFQREPIEQAPHTLSVAAKSQRTRPARAVVMWLALESKCPPAASHD